MKKLFVAALSLSLVGLAPAAALAGPAEDLKAFQAYFKKKFPDVAFDDFANGVYAIDPIGRQNWEAIEEFPPYEANIDDGKKLFETPFANGKTYADCFPGWEKGIRQNYPYFDAKTGKVVILVNAINQCREKNGEKPYDNVSKGDIASLEAYLAFKSRGNKLDIKVPDDPRALAAYENGKMLFYSKRGQLNMACADCHIYYSGSQLRSDILSPALGHPTHFPVYRSSWGELGTLQRRYKGCNEQVRAKAFKPGGAEYSDLEYFETYMSNGLPVNGPGSRK